MRATEEDIEAFVAEQWPAFLADAQRLISIDSSLDASHAALGAPFGPGPRAALDEALAIAQRMGLEPHDGDGYAGFADLPGESGQQIGVIGHVDVVPAGEGWDFDPFSLTCKDGVLVGRGTSDDKAPLLTALYGLKFWLDRGANLRHAWCVSFLAVMRSRGWAMSPTTWSTTMPPISCLLPMPNSPCAMARRGNLVQR